VISVTSFRFILTTVPKVFGLDEDGVCREVAVTVVDPDAEIQALFDGKVDLIAPAEHTETQAGLRVFHENHGIAAGGPPEIDELHLTDVTSRHVLNSHDLSP